MFEGRGDRGPIVRNKANFLIADWEQTCGGTPPAGCRPGPARAGCTNEPNFRGGRPRHPEPVVRNKANWLWWRPRPTPPPQESRRCRARTPNPRRAEGQSCETNPIWPCLGRAVSPAGERCERNPISTGSRWDAVTGPWDTGQMGETKPNLGGIECLGKGRYCLRGPSPERGTCETNPICRRRRVGRGPIVRNEPNLHARGKSRWSKPHPTSRRNCAKRTQFSPAGRCPTIPKAGGLEAATHAQEHSGTQSAGCHLTRKGHWLRIRKNERT